MYVQGKFSENLEDSDIVYISGPELDKEIETIKNLWSKKARQRKGEFNFIYVVVTPVFNSIKR